MAENIVVPRLGVTVKEVTIVEWLVDDGETVSAGQPILTVASDKTEVEVEAASGGTLKHGAAVEEVCKVGQVIGEIG